MKRLFLVLAAFFFVTGFTTCERKLGNPIELPPPSLLNDCLIYTPVKLSLFTVMKEEEREALLVEMNSENIANLHTCNADKESLRKWRDDMAELLKKYE